MIDQVDQRLAPETTLVFFPVLHRGGVERDFLVRDRVEAPAAQPRAITELLLEFLQAREKDL